MAKGVSNSMTEVSHLVLPNDTNSLGFLRGGVLMEWMDNASEITAQKHSQHVVLTVAIDTVKFRSMVKSGDTINIRSQITRAFSTYLEVYVQVWASSLPRMDVRKISEAFFTLVAIRNDGASAEIPKIKPVNEEEWHLYETALERRNNKIEQVSNNYETNNV
jgi:acyl-CoA hydrolase